MMMARLLIFAMLAGAAATVVALGMGLSGWMLLLTYALAGSAALILGGALVALAKSRRAAGSGGAPVDPVHVRVRR